MTTTLPSQIVPFLSPRRRRSAGLRLAAVAALVLVPAVAPAAPVQSPSQAPRSPVVGQHAADAQPSRAAGAPDGDAGSRSVAARARMNECGHQWNNMKHAGTASGTWKEFSRGCLAQK